MGTATAFPNRNTARGTRHGRAKLDDDTVRAIRHRYAAGGATCLSLAAEYDMSCNAIHAVLTRKTWRHVDG